MDVTQHIFWHEEYGPRLQRTIAEFGDLHDMLVTAYPISSTLCVDTDRAWWLLRGLRESLVNEFEVLHASIGGTVDRRFGPYRWREHSSERPNSRGLRRGLTANQIETCKCVVGRTREVIRGCGTPDEHCRAVVVSSLLCVLGQLTKILERTTPGVVGLGCSCSANSEGFLTKIRRLRAGRPA
jgi:hypothetical protein